jgi:hypothetical protein
MGSKYLPCCGPSFQNGTVGPYGGGVGILGAGASGSGGAGGNFNSQSGCGQAGSGGSSPGFGGGGGSSAVRIIWPGCARLFPSTRTANE